MSTAPTKPRKFTPAFPLGSGDDLADSSARDGAEPENADKVPTTQKRRSRAQRFEAARDVALNSKQEFEELRDELQNWLDNIPENLQGGSKADELQSAIDEIETAISALEELENVSPEFPSMIG